MRADLFDELLDSVREGAEILAGRQEPSRLHEVEAPDVRRVREEFGLSQTEFAVLMGICRSWQEHPRPM
jgi:putative transcriptional regulator